MNAEELRTLPEVELHKRLEDNRKELFNLRFQIETRKIKNHQRVPEVRREIARIETILRERELMREYGGVDVEPLPSSAAATTQKETGRRNLLGRLRRG